MKTNPGNNANKGLETCCSTVTKDYKKYESNLAPV